MSRRTWAHSVGTFTVIPVDRRRSGDACQSTTISKRIYYIITFLLRTPLAIQINFRVFFFFVGPTLLFRITRVRNARTNIWLVSNSVFALKLRIIIIITTLAFSLFAEQCERYYYKTMCRYSHRVPLVLIITFFIGTGYIIALVVNGESLHLNSKNDFERYKYF